MPATRRKWLRSAAMAILVIVGLVAFALVFFHRQPPHAEVRPTLRMGMQDSPPWYNFDQRQVISGPVYEIMEEAARRAGMGFVWVSDPRGPEHALDGGVADIWPLMGRLPDRLPRYSVTKPWLELSYALCSRTDCGSTMLRPGRPASVALREGSVPKSMLSGELSSARPLVVGSHLDALLAVCSGKTDAAIVTETAYFSGLPAVSEICRANQACLRLTPLQTVGFGLGSRRNDARSQAAADRLRAELDRMIDDGTMPGILLRWGVPGGEVRALRNETLARERARLMLLIAIVLITAVAALSAVSRKLLIAKRESERIQAELRQSKLALLQEHERRRAAEAQLHQAARLESLGRLAGGIAHDFNNLLTVIRGFSELLLNELPPGARLSRHAEQIANAGARGAELTRQLLLYSRSQTPSMEILSLDDMVREMRPLLASLAGEACPIDFRLGQPEAAVQGDQAQIGRVLMNLVANARDAMPGGGVIRIETFVRPARETQVGERFAVLAVSDTGTGMDEETKKRIFEPFFTTKPKGFGTGMGLSVVQAAIQGLGGSIEVESAPGAGSTFRVVLPMVCQK